jgi:hypothetical protein
MVPGLAGVPTAAFTCASLSSLDRPAAGVPVRYHNHGRRELAWRYLEEALGMHRTLANSRGEARVLRFLGAVLIKQGRADGLR